VLNLWPPRSCFSTRNRCSIIWEARTDKNMKTTVKWCLDLKCAQREIWKIKFQPIVRLNWTG